MSRLKINGEINKDEAKEYGKAFYMIFKDRMQVRNQMLHRRYLWQGKEHARLSLAASAELMDGAIIDLDSLELIKSKEVLSGLIGDVVKQLTIEGRIIRDVLDEMTKIIDFVEE